MYRSGLERFTAVIVEVTMKKTFLSAVVFGLAVGSALPIPANATAASAFRPPVGEARSDVQQIHWRRHWRSGYYGWRGWGSPYGYYRRPYYRPYARYYGSPYYGDYYPYSYYRPYGYYRPYRYYRPYGYYRPYYHPGGFSIWLSF
jgi:hypothetical protein